MMRTESPATVDTGREIQVTAVSTHSVLFVVGGREYRASIGTPRHRCSSRPPLAAFDRLTVIRRSFEGDILAEAPCGCPHLVYDITFAHGTWTEV